MKKVIRKLTVHNDEEEEVVIVVEEEDQDQIDQGVHQCKKEANQEVDQTREGKNNTVTKNLIPDHYHLESNETEDPDEEVDLKGNLFLTVNLNHLKIIIRNLEVLNELVGKIIQYQDRNQNLMLVKNLNNLKILVTVIHLLAIDVGTHQNLFVKTKETAVLDLVRTSDKTKMNQRNIHDLTH